MKLLKSLILFILFLSGCNEYKELKWTAINVNSTGKQGDAHLISIGSKHFMIDTGQKYYVNRTLLPYLYKYRVFNIDGILITHPHFDHYEGLISLLKDKLIKINTIYMNMPTEKQMKKEWWGGKYSALVEIQKLAKQRGVTVLPINRDDRYNLAKNAYIKVLYAYDGIHTPVGQTDINDMSVIAMLYHGKNRFLFTGDLNKKLGSYLGKNAKDIKADILKFPHHGTEGFATNNFFYNVNPKVVIVPGPSGLWCSKRSKRARELVKNNGYKAFINGFHGNISVISNAENFKIKTQFSPKKICE